MARSSKAHSLNQRGSPARGRQRLAHLANAMGRKWGAATALPLKISPTARVKRLPFGILTLDWLTGGGLVVGRINRLVGAKSTLKSTLCLRAVRSAQQHCRHCKEPIVQAMDGTLSCGCPDPRWWLEDEEDYQWLPVEVALRLATGVLPKGARRIKPGTEFDQDTGDGIPYQRASMKFDPPEHLKSKKKKIKRKEVVFREVPSCEPWRVVYLDTEGTIDEAWAAANGVDTELVAVIGGNWGERCLAQVEEMSLTREFDLVVIDSTSVLTPQAELEKGIDEKPKVAARAALMSRFARRHLSAMFEEGLMGRYRPTVLCTNQVTTKGLGYGQHAHVGGTDGHAMDHAVSLDVYMKAKGYEFDKAKRHALWGDFEFIIKKIKAGGASPNSKGSIKFWVRATPNHPVGDSNDLATVMKYAREPDMGFLEEGAGKSKLTLYSQFLEGGKLEFARVGDCAEFLQGHPSIYADLRRRVLEGLMCQDTELEVTEDEGESV